MTRTIALSALCFALPLLYWPGVFEISNTPRWVALAALPAILLISPPREFNRTNLWILLFLAYGAISLIWGTSFWDGIRVLFQFTLIYGAFLVGMSQKSLRAPVFAFCLAVALNGPLALVSEIWGNFGLEEPVAPAGFFANKNYLAEAGLLATVAAFQYRFWPLLPFTLMAALVPFSRAVVLVLAILALWWIWKRSKLACSIVALMGAIVAYQYIELAPPTAWHSMDGRFAFWINSVAMFVAQPWGHGIGSFLSTYPLYHDAWVDTPYDHYRFDSRPRTAHSDVLTILTEMGIIGLALVIVWVWDSAKRSKTILSPVVWAYVLVSLVQFPTFLPTTAFFGALILGRMAGGNDSDSPWSWGWRIPRIFCPARRGGYARTYPFTARGRDKSLPVSHQRAGSSHGERSVFPSRHRPRGH